MVWCVGVCAGDAMLSRHTGIDLRQLQLVGHIASTHSGEVSPPHPPHPRPPPRQCFLCSWHSLLFLCVHGICVFSVFMAFIVISLCSWNSCVQCVIAFIVISLCSWNLLLFHCVHGICVFSVFMAFIVISLCSWNCVFMAFIVISLCSWNTCV